MKRNPVITGIVICIFCLLPGITMAQQKAEQQQSLLWRISGNGLPVPSYLYGTIHLTDKRVFNFGDSLYAALEKSQGYAMELNPDSMMIEYLKDESEKDKKLLVKELSAKDFNRIKAKLKEQFKKSPEKVTVKEFKSYFKEWTYGFDEKSRMQTIMDTYFYDAARRQGKWVGGIEDVSDQRSALNSEAPVESYITDFLEDNKTGKRFLEEMIHVYNRADLVKIENMYLDSDNEEEKKVMQNRNRKMARRIDSLARIRNTFFAVGTAHLPGDSGVISLLRSRGFTLEPVYSSKRIHAETYKFPVITVPWVKVASSNRFYSVDMPGEPQKELSGFEYENMDMQVYADISTNLYYFTMGTAGKVENNEDSILARMVKNIDKRAEIASSAPISLDGIKGKEIIAEAERMTFRVRIYMNAPVVYMAMVGSPMKEAVYTEDAERFFKSFTINKEAEVKAVSWQPVTNNEFGFSLLFPGKPAEKKTESREDNTVTTTHFSAPDLENNGFYQCLVQELKKGYYLTSDTALLNNYRSNIQANAACRLISSRMDSVQGYPAVWVEFMMNDGRDTFYNKVLHLHRGNRLYFLFVTLQDTLGATKQTSGFFESFKMIPVSEPVWSRQTSPGNEFTTWVTGSITKHTDSTDEDLENEELYDIFDPSGPVTYFIRKTPYPKYFWAKSDSSLLREEVNSSVGYADSLLEYKLVNNGSYKGVEVLIKMPDNHNLKKIRYLLVGDTLYALFGVVAPEFMNRTNNKRFFEEFSISYPPITTNLFTNKSRQLLKALQSEDSASFEQARIALQMVKFEKEDLPVLHKALLEKYRDAEQYYSSTSSQLFDEVAKLEDAGTVEWVKQQYSKLPAEKENIRFDMLYLLASQPTKENFEAIKEFLLQHPPQEGNPWRLYTKLKDTLELAAQIMPGILPLLADSVNRYQVLSLTEELIDSSLLNKSTLENCREAIYTFVTVSQKELQQEENAENWFVNYTLISVLSKLGSPEDFQLIRKYLTQSNLYIKYEAAITLLRNKQKVDKSVIKELAAANDLRLGLYEELDTMKMLSLYPKEFLDPKAFAESQLYSYAEEDDNVKEITFLGEKVVTFKGEKKKFYLFKINMSYDEEEPYIRLGIAGPYPVKRSKPVIYADITGLVWDKDFDEKTVDEDFKEYIKKAESLEYKDNY